MEFNDVSTFIIVLLALAGSISVFGAAAKTVKEWFKPAADLSARIEAVEKSLTSDYKRINDLEESERLTLRALEALLEHEITGNHVAVLEEIRNDINIYLINR